MLWGDGFTKATIDVHLERAEVGDFQQVLERKPLNLV
jgi:hypothetical protein